MVIVDEEFKTKSLKRITYYIYSLLLALKMHLEKKIKKIEDSRITYAIFSWVNGKCI